MNWWSVLLLSMFMCQKKCMMPWQSLKDILLWAYLTSIIISSSSHSSNSSSIAGNCYYYCGNNGHALWPLLLSLFPLSLIPLLWSPATPSLLQYLYQFERADFSAQPREVVSSNQEIKEAIGPFSERLTSAESCISKAEDDISALTGKEKSLQKNVQEITLKLDDLKNRHRR